MGTALFKVLFLAGIFALWNVGTEALLSEPRPAVVELLPWAFGWFAVGAAAPFIGQALSLSRSNVAVVVVIGVVIGLIMTAIAPTYSTAPFLLNWLERAGRYALIFWLLGMQRESRKILETIG